MFAKLFVIIVMLLILFSLGSGLFYVLRDEGKSNKAVKALTWRISLSLGLFLLLMLGFVFGFLKPHGI